MKAIRVHAYGQQPRLDEMPDPQPAGPDDVVVRIGGAGLCRTDLHIQEGQWAEKSQVQLMVRSLLQLTEVVASEDASDALAIAICHATHPAARAVPA